MWKQSHDDSNQKMRPGIDVGLSPSCTTDRQVLHCIISYPSINNSPMLELFFLKLFCCMFYCRPRLSGVAPLIRSSTSTGWDLNHQPHHARQGVRKMLSATMKVPDPKAPLGLQGNDIRPMLTQLHRETSVGVCITNRKRVAGKETIHVATAVFLRATDRLVTRTRNLASKEPGISKPKL